MVQIPRVPSVNQQVGGIAPYQAPGTTPIEDFTGKQFMQLGQNVEQLGRGVTRLNAYFERQEDQLNEARAMQADNRLRDTLADAYDNPQTGYKYTLGEDSQTKYQPTLDSVYQKVKEIEDSLENPMQKRLFRLNADKRMFAFKRDVDDHFGRQQKIFHIGQTEASENNFRADAIKHVTEFDAKPQPGEVNRYLQNKKTMEDYVTKKADMLGYAANDPRRVELLRESRNQLHSAAIAALSDDNGVRAQAYYERYKDEMSGQASNVSQRTVKAGLKKDDTVSAAALWRQTADMMYEGYSDWAKVDLISDQIDEDVASGKIDAEEAQMIKNHLGRDAEQAEAVRQRAEKQVGDAFTAWAMQDQNQQLDFEQMPSALAAQVEQYGLAPKLREWWNEGKRFTTKPGERESMTALTPQQWRTNYKSADEIDRVWRFRLNNQDLTDAKNRWASAVGSATVTQKDEIAKKDFIDDRYQKMLNQLPPSGGRGLSAGELKNLPAYSRVDFEMELLQRTQDMKKQGLGDKMSEAEMLKKAADEMLSDQISIAGDDVTGASDIAGRQVPYALLRTDVGLNKTGFVAWNDGNKRIQYSVAGYTGTIGGESELEKNPAFEDVMRNLDAERQDAISRGDYYREPSVLEIAKLVHLTGLRQEEQKQQMIRSDIGAAASERAAWARSQGKAFQTKKSELIFSSGMSEEEWAKKHGEDIADLQKIVTKYADVARQSGTTASTYSEFWNDISNISGVSSGFSRMFAGKHGDPNWVKERTGLRAAQIQVLEKRFESDPVALKFLHEARAMFGLDTKSSAMTTTQTAEWLRANLSSVMNRSDATINPATAMMFARVSPADKTNFLNNFAAKDVAANGGIKAHALYKYMKANDLIVTRDKPDGKGQEDVVNPVVYSGWDIGSTEENRKRHTYSKPMTISQMVKAAGNSETVASLQKASETMSDQMLRAVVKYPSLFSAHSFGQSDAFLESEKLEKIMNTRLPTTATESLVKEAPNLSLGDGEPQERQVGSEVFDKYLVPPDAEVSLKIVKSPDLDEKTRARLKKLFGYDTPRGSDAMKQENTRRSRIQGLMKKLDNESK